MMRLSVKVPATSANLGPGFDCMGIALNVFNEMSIEVGEKFAVVIEGESANLLPTDESNVVVRTVRRVVAASGSTKTPGEWRLSMVNGIPVGSGLGSSAAAIVGGLLLGNALLEAFDPNRSFSRTDLLRMAIDAEGHPDNVTPALQGGATLSCPDEKVTHSFSMPIPPALCFVVAVPYFALYTEESRKVVPKTVSRQDAIFNAAQTARLALALSTGQLSMLKHGFGDKLHEPYREPLIRGYSDVKQAALQAGALAVTLSGAGPSMLAWCDGESVAQQVADQMTLTWRESGIACSAGVYRVQMEPTVVTQSEI